MARTIEETGWIRDDEAVARYIEKRNASGNPAMFGSRADCIGQWKKLVSQGVFGVFAQIAEAKLKGPNRRADFQRRGTCVSRGTYRACQDTYYNQLYFKGGLGIAHDLVYEIIYGYARVEIGGGGGWGDGAVGAYAAEGVATLGLLPRGVYGSIDLSASREDLAVAYGSRGCPKELLKLAADHTANAHFVDSMTTLADAIASRCFGAQCSSYEFGDRDQNGMSKYVGPTAHCEEVCGVFVMPDWNGKIEDLEDFTGFVRQNSWGSMPGGNSTLQYYGRNSIELREGSYGVFPKQMRSLLNDRGSETWCFGDIKPWIGSLKEMV